MLAKTFNGEGRENSSTQRFWRWGNLCQLKEIQQDTQKKTTKEETQEAGTRGQEEGEEAASA